MSPIITGTLNRPQATCLCLKLDYSIFFPLSNLFVTLSGDDSSTPVELRRETGGDDQIWKFQQV